MTQDKNTQPDDLSRFDCGGYDVKPKLTLADMQREARSPRVRAAIEAIKSAKLSPEKRAELDAFLEQIKQEGST